MLSSFWSFDYFPLTLVTIILTSILVYAALFREGRVEKFLNKFPGPRPYPLIGSALELSNSENALATFLRWNSEYGDRFSVYLGLKSKNFVPTAPSDVEKILSSLLTTDKSNFYTLIKPWLGDGLLLSAGKKWESRRKMLTPAFHFKILDNFLPIMNEQSQILVQILQEKSANGQIVEMDSLITRCTLDIICETAMGTKLNSQRDPDNVYATATLKQSTFLWHRWTKPWLQYDWIWSKTEIGQAEISNRKILHDFTKQVIKERKRQFYQEKETVSSSSIAPGAVDEEENVYFSSKKKFAFLDLLIRLQDEGGFNLSDRDIQEETDTFMFAGHDTMGSALKWITYLLGLNPVHQTEVHAELDSIFGSDRHRPVTTEDLTRMKFLECCIKEAMRIYPSAAFFSRRLKNDFQLDKENLIPKGTAIIIAPFLIHRNPKFWEDPEQFRPSRFFIENSTGRPAYAYIPFSAGARNCIGQRFAMTEMRVILADLLRNFKIVSVDSREEVKPVPEIVLRPKNGIRLRLFRR